MSLARRLVQESIEIVMNDVEMSDELPTQSERLGEEPFGDLHIDTQLEETNQLLQKAKIYHGLLADFPIGTILTSSEERLFNAAVNMSLAGTGLKAEDLKVVVAESRGSVISQEGIGSVISGTLRAIGNAIAAILRKIGEFFNWLTGRKSKEEREVERIEEGLRQMERSVNAAVLDEAFRAYTSSVEDLASQVLGGRHEPIKSRRVVDVAPGAVIEGDFLVVETKSPNNPSGEKVKIDLSKMINLPWKKIDRLFSAPPTDHRVDLVPVSEHLHQVMAKLSAGLPEVIKQLNALDREIDQQVKGGQTNQAKMISTMRDLAAKCKVLRAEIQREFGFEPHTTEHDRLLSQPILPSGVALEIHLKTNAISAQAPWAKDFEGDAEPIMISIVQPEPKAVEQTFTLHVGEPQQLITAMDRCMKSYFNAFHRVEEVTSELALLMKTKLYDEQSNLAGTQFGTAILRGPIVPDNHDHTAYYFERDLLGLKFAVVSSYTACYAVLSHATAMLAQYKHLYNWLQK